MKCANILVDQSGIIKLTDFGTSKLLSNNPSNKEFVVYSKSLKGSPYWMAPEVVNRSGHSKAADIWSIGGVLIEMITGHPPYGD